MRGEGIVAESCYTPCEELYICREIDQKYWQTDSGKWFAGYLPLAEQGYPLAECQVGYAYTEGIGGEKDLEKALCWTRRAAEHGGRDAALQGHDLAVEKCRELGISL